MYPPTAKSYPQRRIKKEAVYILYMTPGVPNDKLNPSLMRGINLRIWLRMETHSAVVVQLQDEIAALKAEVTELLQANAIITWHSNC